MPDYPDWQQIFRLVGSDITINVNIEASAVTLPISIDAATVTLDVNLTAATATIDINFSDQSTAVFDASKWFAHNADEVFIRGSASIDQNTLTVLASRTVPTGKTFFIGGIAHAIAADSQTPASMVAFVRVAGVIIVDFGSYRGGPTILDVPIRATADQLVEILVAHYGSAGSEVCYGSFWGYDEEV